MLNVGLTGSIACGKSTVGQMFVENWSFHIDFYRLAHAVEEPSQPAWQQIVDYFGSNILNPDRTINRTQLGSIVFEDKGKLTKLNSIVHPAGFAVWHHRIDEIKKTQPDAIILSDVPLLIEAGMQSSVDVVVLVYISPVEQIQRLMTRNGCSREEAEIRFAAQMSIDDKLQYAHIVINNQGTMEETREMVDRVWQELLEREKRKRT